MMNFTIKYPFMENVIQEPVSCNVSSVNPTLPSMPELNQGWQPRVLHPNERLSALFLTCVCIISILYAFLFSNAQVNKVFLTDRDVVSEVMTSFVLSFLWLTSLVSWTASVADLKHYVVFSVNYTKICSDSGIKCLYSTTGELWEGRRIIN
jgi:hypothetical protein